MDEKRSVTHATFVIERTYPASPERVFRAFADPAVKARWFGGEDDWDGPETAFDFRVGGHERHQGRLHDEPELHTFDGVYWDIVPERRIVFAYDMHLDKTRISVSLATVELVPDGTDTRLVYTEQGAFLDEHDTVAAREAGTQELLDALSTELERQAKEGKE
jgi:uncharacterized protein YndB with AHSA1/START domain